MLIQPQKFESMQPPRTFQGPLNDKKVSILPEGPIVRDVLAESSRKRTVSASDPRSSLPSPTVGIGFSGNPEPYSDHSRGREHQSSVPLTSPRDSLNFRSYSGNTNFGPRNDPVTPCRPYERGFRESESECSGSFTRQHQSSNYEGFLSQLHFSAGGTHESSNLGPVVSKDVKPLGNANANSPVGREDTESQFRKSQSRAQQKLVPVENGRPDSNDQVPGSLENLQNSQQNILRPGDHNAGGFEQSRAETPSVQGSADFSSSSGAGCNNILGIKIGNSILSLDETNNFLQHALRVLGASASSGSTLDHNGSSQVCGDGAIATNSTPNSHTQSSLQNPSIQDSSRSLIQATPSKNVELASSTLNKPIHHEKASANLNNELESGNGGLAITENLWDGTLQLSSSVTVPAVAFFKSGEKMQDLSWSGFLEVKGKVRLEAFEKYVQDLPRSRTRGLMVVSIRWKEGCSADGRKGMLEVAKKYKEGKRVGVAELSKGVDMYICPHSDAIITILAKYGFFKGKTAVNEKSDPLIGCVVWRKEPSFAPATKTAEVKTPVSGQKAEVKTPVQGQMLKEPSSEAAAKQVSHENVHTEIGGGRNNGGNKSPEIRVSAHIAQPEQSMMPQSSVTSVRDLNTSMKPSEFPSPTPRLGPENSADDDDLPEFDFGAAVSQSSENKTSATSAAFCSKPEMEFMKIPAHHPISAQMGSESSAVSGALPDLRLQGLVTPNMNHQSASHQLSIGSQQETSRDFTASSRPSVQGFAPQNILHQLEVKIPGLPANEQRQADSHTAMKPRSRFDDDDDMPEWCPPNYKKTRHEANERTGQTVASGSPTLNGSGGFTALANGQQLPPRPLAPPPPCPPSFTPVQFINKNHPEQQLPQPPLPPGPPPRPPVTQLQFTGQNYPSVTYDPRPAVSTYVNNGSPAPSAHVQSNANHTPSPGHQPSMHPLPPPPPPPPRPPVNQVNVFDKEHPSVPHFPKPADNFFMHNAPAANNFMHDRPAAPSTQGQFQDRHYPPAPHHLPSHILDTTPNNVLHRGPATASSRTQFQNNAYASTPQADQPARGGSGDRNSPFPPGFVPEHAFRPQSQQPEMNNHIHHSAWRGPRS